MQLDLIQSILRSTYPFLGQSDLNVFLGICKYQLLTKRQAFIRAGEKSKKTFFILEGMMRGYFISKTGEEKNIFLRPERTITGAPDSLFLNQPSHYTFEAVIDTHLLIFDYYKMLELAKENEAVFQINQLAIQENILILSDRVHGLIDHTPEERYEHLLKRSPHFFQSALNKHIANYLGITPNSLSRIIRRKLKT